MKAAHFIKVSLTKEKLGRSVSDDIGCNLLGERIYRRLRVARRQQGKRAGVDHPQSLDTINASATVHDCHLVARRAHLARTSRVPHCDQRLPDDLEKLLVGLVLPARECLLVALGTDGPQLRRVPDLPETAIERDGNF